MHHYQTQPNSALALAFSGFSLPQTQPMHTLSFWAELLFITDPYQQPHVCNISSDCSTKALYATVELYHNRGIALDKNGLVIIFMTLISLTQ